MNFRALMFAVAALAALPAATADPKIAPWLVSRLGDGSQDSFLVLFNASEFMFVR